MSRMQLTARVAGKAQFAATIFSTLFAEVVVVGTTPSAG